MSTRRVKNIASTSALKHISANGVLVELRNYGKKVLLIYLNPMAPQNLLDILPNTCQKQCMMYGTLEKKVIVLHAYYCARCISKVKKLFITLKQNLTEAGYKKMGRY